MPLNPSPQTISIGGGTAGQSINLELGRSATAQSSLEESALRTLAGRPGSGTTISLSDFWSKSTASYVNPIFGAYNNATFSSLNEFGFASTEIDFNPDGTWAIYSYDTTLGESNNVLGNWITPTTANIGSGRFVRYTRTATSGNSGFSTASTGWLSMAGMTYVEVSAAAFDYIPKYRQATYFVEIATDSSGINIVTSGTVTISATATEEFSGGFLP